MKKIMTVCIAVLFSWNVSFASIPVIDGGNLAQNILTALQTLQSNLNEATMIVNQIQQIEHQILNLTELDFSIGEEFSEQLHDLFSQVGEVQGLMQDLGSLQADFEELYPELNEEELADGERVSELINNALNESRSMMLGAAKTGARVLEDMPKTQSQLDRLLSASESSVGNLQAIQAGNQISATVSSNIMSLTTMFSTYAQAHMSFMQRINLDAAVSENRRKHALEHKLKT